MPSGDSALLDESAACDLLRRVVRGMRIGPQTSTVLQPGDEMLASVVPAAPELALDDLAVAGIELVWGTVTQTPPDELPLPSLGGGTSDLSDLQALGGRVAPPRLRVLVDVRWKLTDKDGVDQGEGHDVGMPAGSQATEIRLQIPPALRELTLEELENPVPTWFCLSAEVTLTIETGKLDGNVGGPCAAVNDGALGSSTADRISLTRRLPGIPIAQLPVLIPTMVLVGTEPNFDLTTKSALLIVVPEDSPLTNAQAAFEEAKRLEKIVRSLRRLGGAASWLLGLEDVLAAIPEQPVVRFKVAKKHNGHSGINNLGGIKLRPRPWYHFLNPHDSMHNCSESVAVVGPPGRRVRFYDAKNFKTMHGAYTIQVDVEAQAVAVIPDLNTPDDVKPVTTPAGRVLDNGFEKSTEGTWARALDSLEFLTFQAEGTSGLTPPDGLCDLRAPRDPSTGVFKR